MSNHSSDDQPAEPTPRRRTALDWPVENDAAPALLLLLQKRRRRRRHRALVAGSSLAVILMMGFLGLHRKGEDPAPNATARVSLPETRTLPDGSIAELRDGAEIELAFSATERRIELRRGEAHFQVTKDPARPFLVSTSTVAIRAVGTAFSVRLGEGHLEVLVTEGRVAVDRKADARPAVVPRETIPEETSLAFVTAGERAMIEGVDPSEITIAAVTRIDDRELSERLSWRVPRLEFSSTPLKEAIAMFNRHSAVQIVIRDAGLEHLRISGIVRGDQADALVSLLVANYDVIAERHATESSLLIRSK